MVGSEEEVVPFAGQVFVADTSAWARSDHPAVRSDWDAAILNGQIATSPIVEIEVLHSARSANEFDAIAADTLNSGMCQSAVRVLHYDADFDTLATVLSFESRWIAPAGSL